MKSFAVLDENNKVVNMIVAESLDDAQSVTGQTCVEYSMDTKIVNIGYNYDGTYLFEDQPYASWTLDGNGDWQPPVPKPEIDPENPKEPVWNETTQSWN